MKDVTGWVLWCDDLSVCVCLQRTRRMCVSWSVCSPAVWSPSSAWRPRGSSKSVISRREQRSATTPIPTPYWPSSSTDRWDKMLRNMGNVGWVSPAATRFWLRLWSFTVCHSPLSLLSCLLSQLPLYLLHLIAKWSYIHSRHGLYRLRSRSAYFHFGMDWCIVKSWSA